jgi:hypoxanthine phosphoribosyltransferase
MDLPILIEAARIRARVEALGQEIAARLDGDPALEVVVLMDGAFCFAADLVRSLPGSELRLHFVRAGSYGAGTVSSGRVALGPWPRIDGGRVLIVDDILDSGRTLAAAVAACGAARQVLTCVLLDKPSRRAAEGLAEADLVGFRIEDAFVVGYGLDHGGRFRHLPHIHTLPAVAPSAPSSPGPH